MSKKAKIIEAEKMETAKALEAEGDYVHAIKTYRSILAKNPVHLHSASRLLILLRKGKDIKAEMKLLKNLISSQQAHLKTLQQNWISTHQKVAEATRPLASILGLLDTDGQPGQADDTLTKWKSRLQGLEKRLSKQVEKNGAKLKQKKKPNSISQTPNPIEAAPKRGRENKVKKAKVRS